MTAVIRQFIILQNDLTIRDFRGQIDGGLPKFAASVPASFKCLTMRPDSSTVQQ
jgi:hypothetical protein